MTSPLLVLQLIVLHRVDGGEVLINPSAVASLHMESAAKHNRVVAPMAQCAIGLTNGKFVFVTEACAEVQRRLGQ